MAVSEFGIAHRCWLTPVIVKLQPSGAFFGVTVKRQGIIVKSEPLANSTCLREHRELLFHRDFADLISELHSFLLGSGRNGLSKIRGRLQYLRRSVSASGFRRFADVSILATHAPCKTLPPAPRQLS